MSILMAVKSAFPFKSSQCITSTCTAKHVPLVMHFCIQAVLYDKNVLASVHKLNTGIKQQCFLKVPILPYERPLQETMKL